MAESDDPNDQQPDGGGYGDPPHGTRFKKGRSGNPKGRPKGVLNVATVLNRTLREKVIVNENGRRIVLTKLEAAIKQLVNRAASGEGRAIKQLLDLVTSAEERPLETPVANAAPSDIDEKVMQGILERFENINKGDKDDETNGK
jgi:uncharacterized protein DUF5681